MQSKRSTIMTRLVTIVSSLTVILVLAHNACAQSQLKVTASPPTVTDASKPGDVVLHVTRTDNAAIDATFVSQLKVKVGGTDVAIKSPDIPNANITITPPANLAGSQSVQLFGSNNQLLGDTSLQYPGQSPPATSSTPGPIEIRQNSLSQSWWYRVSVLVLFALLLVVFGFTIYRVIRYSKSSFRNAGGFPVGSFRAILAFTLVAYLGFYILASVLSITSFPLPDSLLGIVATVIGFYFGSRNTEEGSAEAGPAGLVRGMVTAGPNPARGALVKFKREDGTEPYIRVTDVEGHFTAVNAKPGKYTVRAEVTGLPPGEVTITVSDGSDQEIVIPIKTAQTPAPQTTGTVQGTVTKADSTTVQGASVVLSPGNATPQKTDANGKYKFENVAVGDYNIVASLGNVSSESKKITVAAGAAQTVDLQLKG
jgi:hypothetical protein